MSYVDNAHFRLSSPLIPGKAYDAINFSLGHLKGANSTKFNDFECDLTTSDRTPREQRLAEIQRAISGVSMHLPNGFAVGLNRQFANLFADDAWEDEDELPQLSTVKTFIDVLFRTDTALRPGIGTNGRGSISAFWIFGGNRLTIECQPNYKTTWVTTRVSDKGEVERAAGECSTTRLLDILCPFNPGIWFDK